VYTIASGCIPRGGDVLTIKDKDHHVQSVTTLGLAEKQARDHMVPVASLRCGPSPRRGSVRADHVEALMQTHAGWPPILVHQDSLVVIDGHHRMAAARTLGLSSIEVVYFNGDDDDAEIEAIRRNVTHGLPLTLAERQAAIKRLLKRRPDWSDSRIADICGVSSRTVGRCRKETEPSPSNLDRRVGRDGKRRPTNPEAVRGRVVQLLDARPGLSLRQAAAEVGASKETIRSVRKRLEASVSADKRSGLVVTLPCEAMPLPPSVVVGESPHTPRSRISWSADSACSSTLDGQAFACWFDAHSVQDVQPITYTSSVPLSRIYDVIDESRRRSEFWASFAAKLRDRIH
jgi:ParB-like chromosome segregation protein Spo0J